MDPVVLDAIQSLLAEGKTPTVALTKARLKAPVAMPTLIAGVSAYKNDPEGVAKLGKPTIQAATAAQTQTQLDRIEAKLDQLLALLSKGN
ncbi:hypothetical protein ACFOEE_03895 [Pseudoalteromonas fenneropenaei]|uniref:KfrA N-terminal DNA-binding domain-containing protein n=1 Tax=Pseudoalteromonas fenneropenaei TaxID=1737459 RepID=A0ABV7CGD5_9GAMM